MSDTVTTLGLETVPGDYTITERSPLLEARERKRIEAILGTTVSQLPVTALRIPLTHIDAVPLLLRVIDSAYHYQNFGQHHSEGYRKLHGDGGFIESPNKDFLHTASLFRSSGRHLEIVAVPPEGPNEHQVILGISGSLEREVFEGNNRREAGQETAIAFGVVDFYLLPGDVQMILEENLRESE